MTTETAPTSTQRPPRELAQPEQTPLRELMQLAVPTVMQMASYTLMQFLDTLMLARALGPMAPAAASNSGIFSYAVIGLGMGTLFIVNTLVSQNFGRGEFRLCGQYLWQGLWVSLLYWIAILLPAAIFFPSVFRGFGHSPAVVEMEGVYARILFVFAIFKLVQTALSQFMLATNRPNAVLLSSVIGIAANAIAAWAMLFGHLGFRSMGIRGAAYGQAIGMFVEMITLVWFTGLSAGARQKFGLLDWRWRGGEMKTLLRLGISSGFQFTAEVAAWSLFLNWVFGRLGETAMEANAFMFRYLALTFLPIVGISTAVTALVGRYIGMNRTDLATQRAHLGYRVALVYLVIAGAVYIIYRHALIRLFTADAEVIRLGGWLMIFAAGYELFDAMYLIYSGALRGAGDTFIPACATISLCWTFMLMGGYAIAVLRPQWSVVGPWSAASFYSILIGFFMVTRFRRGGWKLLQIEAGQ